MSIQKHLNPQPYLRQLNENPAIQYRVRNLSRGHSMKQLHINIQPKNKILAKINNKYTHQTSFFFKQNINNLQVQSKQDLPKHAINVKRDQPKTIMKNASHRILRKVTSHQILPQSTQSMLNISSMKDSFINNQNRKVSLKKKVQLIKKKIDQNKTKNFFSQQSQIHSQQILSDKKKSKSKLKILVRDPFQARANDRRRTQLFLQSRIEHQNNMSMISQSNKQQFEEFLSCLN